MLPVDGTVRITDIVVVEAYRTGAGVPYPDFGVDTREGIAEMNRPMFLNLLGQAWLYRWQGQRSALEKQW